MNRLIAGACIAASFAIAGCDNGGSSSGPGGPDDPPQSSPPPPFVAEQFDCATDGMEKTSDENASPGGFWFGMLVNCSTGTENQVFALVGEDGRFRMFLADASDSADLLRGVLKTDGDTFVTDSGALFSADGVLCSTCYATSMFATGFVREKEWLEGRWGAEWGGSGYFYLRYEQSRYEIPGVVSRLVGDWEVWSSGDNGPVVNWTITDDGGVSGLDVAGCTYTGDWAVADNRFNLVRLEVLVFGCAFDGYYSGLAAWAPGPFNDRLFVSIDDEEQTALQLTFFSP